MQRGGCRGGAADARETQPPSLRESNAASSERDFNHHHADSPYTCAGWCMWFMGVIMEAGLGTALAPSSVHSTCLCKQIGSITEKVGCSRI